MDADDYFCTPKSLSILYETIEKNKSDLVISKFVSEVNKSFEIKTYNYIWLHGKIFSREFINKNEITFNNSRANEDCGFNFLFKFHRPKVTYIDNVTYIWSQNINSTTRKKDENYNYTGLEGLCYNIAWASKIAMSKKIDIREAKLTTLRAMITMWYEYSQYYGIYNTNNILSWTKGLKEVYDQNKDYYIGEEVIEEEIENKKRFILEEQKQITPCITFENFLELVDKSPISEYKNI